MTLPIPPCLTCSTPRDEWVDPEHEFSPCCSDECLTLAWVSGNPRLMVNDRPLSPRQLRDVVRWLWGDDVGTSSKTIAAAIVGIASRGPFSTALPRDPGDFRRCLILLEELPWMRERLPMVAKRHPEWSALVEQWNELEVLWHEEAPTGRCPKLYDRLQEMKS